MTIYNNFYFNLNQNHNQNHNHNLYQQRHRGKVVEKRVYSKFGVRKIKFGGP
jgi:hypothetical protein